MPFLSPNRQCQSTNGISIEALWCQDPHLSLCKTCKTPVKMLPFTNQHPVLLQAGCPSCHPTNSVKALKGKTPFVHSISWNYLLSHLSASDFSTADFTASQTQSTLSADVVDLTESMLPADRADQARLDPLMYIVCVTSSLLQRTEQQENVADQ